MGVEIDVRLRQFFSVELNLIRVPKELRGKGLASQFLEQFINLADDHWVILTLSPSDSFGSNINRLNAFYKRYGFRKNSGRKADHRFSGAMIREPKIKNEKMKTKQQAIQECIRLIEKITGKKVSLKEYFDQEESNDDIAIMGDEDFDNETNEDAMLNAILGFINDYTFDLDYSEDLSASEIKKEARIECLRAISNDFDIDWNIISDKSKSKISTAINSKLMKIKLT